MKKIAVTGGSGFIGTNLIQYLIDRNFEVVNFDIRPPRNSLHFDFWRYTDIREKSSFLMALSSFEPDAIIHLAAVTDLTENIDISYYAANTDGVSNLVSWLINENFKGRVIFTSSMLVNAVGYTPANAYDYNPNTLYGQSKVIGEKIVSLNSELINNFCTVRPTSIWGPWFGEPYRNFFSMVQSGYFFRIHNLSSTKTYGYVGNTILQIYSLLIADRSLINNRFFYLGDSPAININDWANEICDLSKIRPPIVLPYFIFYIASLFGDLLGKFGINFPITTFRLKNMTTNHNIDLKSTEKICDYNPINRRAGTIETLNWLNSDCNS